MGQDSKIAWTNHTFNPWWGCAKVSAGCKNCYAETWAARFGVLWGTTASRRVFGEKHWDEPRKWNRSAEKAGIRARVFCASMADVFDEHGPEEERTRLWRLINETPWLDWLMLTKRPQNIVDMLPFIEIGGEKLPRFDNVWLGTTVESQAAADERIPILLATPAAVRFLSVEPQLEEVRILCPHCGGNGNDHRAGDGGGCSGSFPDWVIVGGESGSKARPFHVEWARSIRDQCRAAGVTFFMKQMGAYPVVALGSEETWPNSTLFEFDDDGKGEASRACLKDCAGADPSEWPEDFRVRQFPKGRS